MNTLPLRTEELMDQLLAVLDVDIQHLEDSIALLDRLRELVIKQDNESLGQLLNTIQSKTTVYRNNELKRQALRRELALLLGCDMATATLSRLEAELTGPRKVEISSRKTTLRTLANRLKTEFAGTQRLLADCTRFNRMLLKSIFQMARPETATYTAAGAAKRQADNVFINVQY